MREHGIIDNNGLISDFGDEMEAQMVFDISTKPKKDFISMYGKDIYDEYKKEKIEKWNGDLILVEKKADYR